MKGIKWPQIKGNLGSKACICVNVTWSRHLLWHRLPTLVIHTPGKLCSLGPCAWWDVHWSALPEDPWSSQSWSLSHVTLSSCHLSLWLRAHSLGCGCRTAWLSSFVCIALWALLSSVWTRGQTRHWGGSLDMISLKMRTLFFFPWDRPSHRPAFHRG